MTIAVEIRESIDKILHQAGMWTEGWQLKPLACGGNNRVFELNSLANKLLLKIYFYHIADQRDRLYNEFVFSQFVWHKGIHDLPKPLCADYGTHIGLYEFIPGTKLQVADINADIIKMAMQFIIDINKYRSEALCAKIHNASEACFSIADHLVCVKRRLHKFDNLHTQSLVDKAAMDFITMELKPLWQMISADVLRKMAVYNINVDEPINESEKCLSPSDFGFHNALLQADGRLKFLDFEYAGWDDPCKLICDFFCQVAVPVSMDYFEIFAKGLLEQLGYADSHYERARLLLPIYRIKWCCIVLNHFIAVDSKRRFFAGNLINDEQKTVQLEKARHIARCIREDFSYGG